MLVYGPDAPFYQLYTHNPELSKTSPSGRIEVVSKLEWSKNPHCMTNPVNLKGNLELPLGTEKRVLQPSSRTTTIISIPRCKSGLQGSVIKRLKTTIVLGAGSSGTTKRTPRHLLVTRRRAFIITVKAFVRRFGCSPGNALLTRRSSTSIRTSIPTTIALGSTLLGFEYKPGFCELGKAFRGDN